MARGLTRVRGQACGLDDHCDRDDRGDTGDCGGIITGWIIKLALGLAIFGVVAFDAVAIGVAHIGAVDDADTAAHAASSAWQDAHGAKGARDLAYQAALAVAKRHGETIEPNSFTVGTDGAVHLTLRRVASTVAIRHVSPLRGLAVTEADGSARAPQT